MVHNLDKIYIRARNNEGKWGSYSLQELHEMGRPIEVWTWFCDRVFGFKEGVAITLRDIDMMVNVMKILGINIVELKDEEEELNDKEDENN